MTVHQGKSLWLATTTLVAPLASIFERIDEHLEYEQVLLTDGYLLASGPVVDASGAATGDGYALLAANTLDHACELVERDPLVAAGLRSVTIREWNIRTIGERGGRYILDI